MSDADKLKRAHALWMGWIVFASLATGTKATGDELAEIFGVLSNTISRWKNGHSEPPYHEIAALLGVTFEQYKDGPRTDILAVIGPAPDGIPDHEIIRKLLELRS